MRARLLNREPKETAETDRSEMVREALAGMRAIGRTLPANSRESPGTPRGGSFPDVDKARYPAPVAAATIACASATICARWASPLKLSA